MLFDQDGGVVNHAAVFAFGVAGFGLPGVACSSTRAQWFSSIRIHAKLVHGYLLVVVAVK